MSLISEIRAAATSAGLDAVGVCDARPFDDTERDIRERVAAGQHGGLSFTYREPELATDVTRSFPWANSLVVGLSAYVPASPGPAKPEPGAGRVARFATDDHYVPLRDGLGVVADLLRNAGHQAEILVDDNRLVDRAAAVRAGVAWWGKSTMVLAPRLGPWFLIGSVVTDLSLESDEQMTRDCGTCVACIPACPTGAIVAPGVLDARRCLSALLQRPGWIPRDLRIAQDTRLYGCDDCLDACPPGHRLLEVSPKEGSSVDLVEVLGLDDRSLRQRFSHFFVPRNDSRFLRRNALVALGNAGGSAATLVCAGYLGHPDSLLRGHAAWALGRIGGTAAKSALLARGAGEADTDVRDEIDAALGSLG